MKHELKINIFTRHDETWKHRVHIWKKLFEILWWCHYTEKIDGYRSGIIFRYFECYGLLDRLFYFFSYKVVIFNSLGCSASIDRQLGVFSEICNWKNFPFLDTERSAEQLHIYKAVSAIFILFVQVLSR